MQNPAYHSQKQGLLKTIALSSLVALGLNFWQFALAIAGDGGRSAFVLQNQATPSPSTAPATKADASSAVQSSPTPAVTPTAASDPAARAASRLQTAGLKPEFASLYLQAAQHSGTPWQLLAAVHRVESTQSPSTNRASYAGAIGPMQFLPSTFRAYGVDGDGNGTADITNLTDSMYSAGAYLAASGADKGNYRTALYAYNHSNAYVTKVLGIARTLGL
jgi:membrane-bound lytic murein transglycosylase B